MKGFRTLTSFVRVLCYNLLNGGGKSLPLNTKIDRRTRLYSVKGARIIVGPHVTLRSTSKGYHCGMPFACTLLADRPGSLISIGNHSRINGAYLHAQSSITVGRNSLIAAGVNILDSNGHPLYSADRTTGRDTPSPILIGDNVWIGLNAIILKGTTIGDNSVVSAGSVVQGDFPPNSLIEGNPAKVVKTIHPAPPSR